MREALAEYFRVLSFTTVDAGRNHFQSFVLEKPGRRFHNRRPLTLGVAKRALAATHRGQRRGR
jgi:hypothetical protein